MDKQRIHALKKQVYEANLGLVEQKLVMYTWGNVSAIDRELGIIAIKPSGLAYDKMCAEDMVLLNLEGEPLEKHWRPSSDTPTHLVIYKAFPHVGGVAHTHSTHAVVWAQAGLSIPCMGTTHADYFYGSIPCSRPLKDEEIQTSYEENTGWVIAETFNQQAIDPLTTPGVLISNHGPFTFGKDADSAVYHAAVLEEVARMAMLGHSLRPDAPPVTQALMDKHYLRKHGKDAYYGQNS